MEYFLIVNFLSTAVVHASILQLLWKAGGGNILMLIFYLQLLWTAGGACGVHTVHALLPVVQDIRHDTGSVIIQLPVMVDNHVSVKTTKLQPVTITHVRAQDQIVRV